MELKSSANGNWHLPGSNAPGFIAVQAEIARVWRSEGPRKDQRRIKEGSKNSQIAAAEATYIGSLIAIKRAVVDLPPQCLLDTQR
jgi:hypothetical protein